MDDRTSTSAQLLEDLRSQVAALESRAADQARTIALLEQRHQAVEELERQLQQRTTELSAAESQLRREVDERRQAEAGFKQQDSLLRRLLDLQDRDWQLVAYEIHDGLAQQLAGAVFRLRNSERLFFENPQQSKQDFFIGMQWLEEALRETRRLIAGLRPHVLDEAGVVPAIENLVAQNGNRGCPQVELINDTGLDRLAAPLESAVFRIVRESLNNACRHSRSPRVRVMLRREDRHLRVEVEDWGVGFDPSRVDEGHFGLEGIRERARLFGGNVTIDSAPGRGTRIVAELPIDFTLETHHEPA